ncbi:MarR family transcriptional regulator [Amphritea sp.]|uniref:MarR family winged helix-turn-helix transcriptional regulator n=1 Tax=Amphritea sp. TaxID=1872502 RepID=UPI0025BF276B|nr:MarR family transcriptional regulator [Amphritea sp.]
MTIEITPQNCIFHLLAKASRAGARHWKSEVSDLGITAVQGKVLIFLHTHGEVTASELSELIALDSATLTGLIDRLVAMDLVARHTKVDDRRAVLIRLTDNGQELSETVYKRMLPANEKFLHDFSDAEAAMLKDMLKRL